MRDPDNGLLRVGISQGHVAIQVWPRDCLLRRHSLKIRKGDNVPYHPGLCEILAPEWFHLAVVPETVLVPQPGTYRSLVGDHGLRFVVVQREVRTAHVNRSNHNRYMRVEQDLPSSTMYGLLEDPRIMIE